MTGKSSPLRPIFAHKNENETILKRFLCQSFFPSKQCQEQGGEYDCNSLFSPHTSWYCTKSPISAHHPLWHSVLFVLQVHTWVCVRSLSSIHMHIVRTQATISFSSFPEEKLTRKTKPHWRFHSSLLTKLGIKCFIKIDWSDEMCPFCVSLNIA